VHDRGAQWVPHSTAAAAAAASLTALRHLDRKEDLLLAVRPLSHRPQGQQLRVVFVFASHVASCLVNSDKASVKGRDPGTGKGLDTLCPW
jgi:hypothetical protein